MERTVTKLKVQITNMEVNVIYLQAILPTAQGRVTALEYNVIKMGGQVSRLE